MPHPTGRGGADREQIKFVIQLTTRKAQFLTA